MRKKIKTGAIILAVLVITLKVGIDKVEEIHENSYVEFADETMGQVLCNAIRGNDNITPENVTYKDLEKIKELNIGYIGYYDSIKDIQYCTGLKELHINRICGEEEPAYFVNHGEVNKEVSPEMVDGVQQELEEILPKLQNLEWMTLIGYGGVEWTSLEFLKENKQIQTIRISACKASDYSVLKTCTALRSISIEYSKISKAEDLMGLEHIEDITLYRTPIAKNLVEIKKLKVAYPHVEIYY